MCIETTRQADVVDAQDAAAIARGVIHIAPEGSFHIEADRLKASKDTEDDREALTFNTVQVDLLIAEM